MEGAISILVASWRDEDRNRILTALTGQNDFHIAGIEKDEAGALIKSAHLKPDVLIMDLQLPGTSGPEFAPLVRRRSPDTAIVMMCDKDADDYAGRALKAGISGFLLKETDTDILVPVVKIVFSGRCYVSASITLRVFNAVIFMKQYPGQTIDEKTHLLFSPAERGIINYVAQGFSDDEIAKNLNLSIGTIRNYLSAIKRKTNVRNRAQIVNFSHVYGLIDFKTIDNF